jgi:hypothetical protein
MGRTLHTDRPRAAWDVLESGDAAASMSSLSATVARASTSASTGARGTAPSRPLAALPAATSQDIDARQSSLPAMATCLGTGNLAGAMRTTPRVSPPPAALAAPPAIAIQNASGIETAGGDGKGVAQHTLTPLPLRAVNKTVQTAVAAAAARAGTAACTDGCAGGNCSKTHVWTFVPAAILAATAPAIANPYLNATTGTAADTGGEGAVQRARGHFVPCHCTDAELRAEDPRLQRLTNADHWLCSVYGNTIHQNDGTHLDGGIGAAEDAKWQRLHLRVAACTLPLYDLPNSRWAHWFWRC